jgi:alkylhydroperoxidase family enzyme
VDRVREHTLRHGSRTPRALRELVILRGAQVSASEYEWAQHLRMARKAGVREAQDFRARGWRTSPEFDAREKAALQLAESVTSGRVGDEAYREALQALRPPRLRRGSRSPPGFYAMVARVLDAEWRSSSSPISGEYSPKLP